MVFGWAQVVMDIQPLVVLITGEGQLHGFSHTYIGATLLGVFSAVSGKYLSEIGLTLIGISKIENPIKISWFVAFLSAFIGTYSHIILDAIMHSDMQPYYPVSMENSFITIITIKELHLLCLYSAGVGTVLFFVIQILVRKYYRTSERDAR